ncbi:hypothetical protein GOV04_02735 [Candidatus Woesearchaeota archaeon]|nr:hypothetical protein [Candidatus Woesearchaeota archaeon]
MVKTIANECIDEFVALANGLVVSHGKDPLSALEEASEEGHDNPALFYNSRIPSLFHISGDDIRVFDPLRMLEQPPAYHYQMPTVESDQTFTKPEPLPVQPESFYTRAKKVLREFFRND